MEESMKNITKFFNHPLILLLLISTIIGASRPSAKAAKNQPGFYLTKEVHIGSQALAACAEGYHMASLWEIVDTSNLRYNTALGITSDDSGSGPPTGIDAGWIRTGGTSEGQIIQLGIDNCFAWSSGSPADHGTAVRPARGWGITSFNTDPWDSGLFTCDNQRPVWCVED
jgi:hypothetical protein